MNEQQRREFTENHECNFAISARGIGRFRVSAFYQRNLAGMVLRRIETNIPTIEELKLPDVLKKLSMTKRGLVLFVGATGTGKSTSLASMIGYRNKNSAGTSSPSKTRSNSSTSTRIASSPSAKWASTPAPSRWP